MSTSAPLTPAECDLRDFPRMMVDVPRLLGSEFNALASRTPVAWMVGHKLWYRAWHQVPAGSLPDDDDQLCHIAELGFDLKTFRKVRGVALRGWVKATDGRLYHRVVAEAVLEAWIEKLLSRLSSQAGNAKRYKHEFDPAPLNAAIAQSADLLASINPRSRGLDKLKRRQSRQEPGGAPGDLPPGLPGDLPPGAPVGSQETGTETGTGSPKEKSSEPDGSASLNDFDPDRRAWSDGVTLLTSQGGLAEPAAKKFIGGLLSRNRLKPRDLLPAITTALVNGTPDPQAYLTAAAKRIASGTSGSLPFGRGDAAPPVPL